jgi:hypothetical protein
MPNFESVNAPINVMGVGRSGSSLLLAAVAGAYGYQNCGETMQAILGTYFGFSSGQSHDRDGGPLSHEDLARTAVHAAIVAAMPSSKPGWVQKLAGIPKLMVLDSKIEKADRDYGGAYAFPYSWYWEVLANLFPAGKNILCIRNPVDICSSRQSMSAWAPRDVWLDVCLLAKIMLYPAARVDAVFDLDHYQADPDAMVGELSAALSFDVAPGFVANGGHNFSADPNHDYSGGYGRQKDRDATLAKINPTADELALLEQFRERYRPR